MGKAMSSVRDGRVSRKTVGRWRVIHESSSVVCACARDDADWTDCDSDDARPDQRDRLRHQPGQ